MNKISQVAQKHKEKCDKRTVPKYMTEHDLTAIPGRGGLCKAKI